MEIAPFTADHPENAIHYWAQFYGVSYVELYATLHCETGGFTSMEQSFYPDMTGPNDREDSWGVAQIHLPAHKDVTKDEALDPDFAIRWAAKEFSEGRAYEWTCFRHLDLSHISAPSVETASLDDL